MSESERNARREALRRAFAEQLPHRVRQIEATWSELVAEGWSRGHLDSLRVKAQSLAGSSEAFGLHRLADAARRLHLRLDVAAAAAGPPDEETQPAITRLVVQLKEACLESTGAGTTEVLGPEDSEELGQPRTGRVLFLLGGDPQLAEDLGFELGCFGYLLRWFREPDELLAIIAHAPPLAVLVDAEPFDERLAQAERIRQAEGRAAVQVPLLFLSSRSDLEARLRAVRCGGVSFFTRPLDTRRLIERLDLFAPSAGFHPFRVLIVEPDYSSALDHSLTLQGAGMEVRLVQQPEAVWEALVDFKPDLMLLSTTLPQISGLDLAAVVRQQDVYSRLPIVLLSTDQSLAAQVDAIRSEANDLLSPEGEPRLLISVVSHHIQRARALGRFIETDSLTGLLNHTRLAEQIDVELGRARRHGYPVAYAILDIDHLHSINETVGHLSGDAVLRGLAELLRRRLRRTDLIGRWGGDEFVVLLTDTAGPSALRVLDGLLLMFAGLPHRCGEQRFFPTISGGVAAASADASAQRLHAAAVDALERARAQGRNQIVLAPGEA